MECFFWNIPHLVSDCSIREKLAALVSWDGIEEKQM